MGFKSYDQVPFLRKDILFGYHRTDMASSLLQMCIQKRLRKAGKTHNACLHFSFLFACSTSFLQMKTSTCVYCLHLKIIWQTFIPYVGYPLSLTWIGKHCEFFIIKMYYYCYVVVWSMQQERRMKMNVETPCSYTKKR